MFSTVPSGERTKKRVTSVRSARRRFGRREWRFGRREWLEFTLASSHS
jgi:hypothetical protein